MMRPMYYVYTHNYILSGYLIMFQFLTFSSSFQFLGNLWENNKHWVGNFLKYIFDNMSIIFGNSENVKRLFLLYSTMSYVFCLSLLLIGGAFRHPTNELKDTILCLSLSRWNSPFLLRNGGYPNSYYLVLVLDLNPATVLCCKPNSTHSELTVNCKQLRGITKYY